MSVQRMGILFCLGMPYKQRFQHRKKQAREKRQKHLKSHLTPSESESSITVTDESSITVTEETYDETPT